MGMMMMTMTAVAVTPPLAITRVAVAAAPKARFVAEAESLAAGAKRILFSEIFGSFLSSAFFDGCGVNHCNRSQRPILFVATLCDYHISVFRVASF
jgi:ABC-type dipeptide/oligopeptide/nickel transport system permease subunit